MTPFERAIWEKANRERREAQDKANQERREAQARLDVERRAARDKYVSDLRRQLDKLRQELREAATSKRKGQIQSAIAAALRQLDLDTTAVNPGAAAIAAGKEASQSKSDKLRADRRGLAFCDVGGMAKRAGEMMAAFDLGLSQSADLVEPQMPTFLGENGMWGTPGWYDLNSSIERWIGPEASGEVAVEGTYFRKKSDAEFDAIWGAWLDTIGPIDNILWNANELAEFVGSLVGGGGVDRAIWRPGRIDRNAFLGALATVKPEASVAWNSAFGNVPTPPGSITLTTFSDSGFTYPDSHGDYYLMAKRRPENHDSSGSGFEVAQELWDTWLDDLGTSYALMLEARAALAASRPALERAVAAFRPFGLGTQYRFRGY